MQRLSTVAGAIVLAATAAHASDDYQAAMQAYLDAQIAPWSQDPMLIEAIRSQNSVTAGYDQGQIDALDQKWRAEVGTGATPTITPVLENPLAAFLRDRVVAAGGTITEIFVMDNKGLNVAASAVTSDYWQGDEAKFQETYARGAGAVHFGEVEFDESSQSFQGQISLAIVDPATQEPVGAMTVGVNAEALF